MQVPTCPVCAQPLANGSAVLFINGTLIHVPCWTNSPAVPHVPSASLPLPRGMRG